MILGAPGSRLQAAYVNRPSTRSCDSKQIRVCYRIMPRPLSSVAPDWWDYTTLDPELISDAARLAPLGALMNGAPQAS